MKRTDLLQSQKYQPIITYLYINKDTVHSIRCFLCEAVDQTVIKWNNCDHTVNTQSAFNEQEIKMCVFFERISVKLIFISNTAVEVSQESGMVA